MGELKVLFHDHPLLPFTRFASGVCYACPMDYTKLYGGYFCNDEGCHSVMYHKECAEALPEINLPSHHDHPLQLVSLVLKLDPYLKCSLCGEYFRNVGYSCSVCNFNIHLGCARIPPPVLTVEKSNVHEHSLVRFDGTDLIDMKILSCKVCNYSLKSSRLHYRCHQCPYVFHKECVSEAFHTSPHHQHPLKFLLQVPDYAQKKCLLCRYQTDQRLHHCDVCNFSICMGCMLNPPPVAVVSSTTHEHQLHLVPRHIDFACNACGTQGDGSPYFCLQCNFMIHQECIDLPRVININRHDHRISYTSRLGHGNWTCGVCRKEVDGFYGAYTCSRCPNYVVHARCATRYDVWDRRELEGIPEEEDLEPFEVIDDTTIKHFNHNHNLVFNNEGTRLQENTLCEACVFHIYPEPFYSCKQCNFVIHEKCAYLPRKKRHVAYTHALTLRTSSHRKPFSCDLCDRKFTGMRYQSPFGKMIDVRCGSVSEPFVHECHPHPLYYSKAGKECSACSGSKIHQLFECDECDFVLDIWCAFLPRKVMRYRYDDHPLFLSYGESSVDGEYWCEACESKVNPKKWFYTCSDCGITLHISCVVGDFSYLMPTGSVAKSRREVVPNTSICRLACSQCNSRCKLPFVLNVTRAGVVSYFCSFVCNSLYIF